MKKALTFAVVVAAATAAMSLLSGKAVEGRATLDETALNEQIDSRLHVMLGKALHQAKIRREQSLAMVERE